MGRPKTNSEKLKEAFDKANAERPLPERVKESVSNQLQIGDLITRDIDVSKPQD